MPETNTLGTRFVNARATARWVADLLSNSQAPAIISGENSLTVVRNVEEWQTEWAENMPWHGQYDPDYRRF